MDRWATFDRYGTLIDWNAGIRAALAGIWPDDDPEALLARAARARGLMNRRPPRRDVEDGDGHAIAVVALNIAGHQVQTIHAVANPRNSSTSADRFSRRGGTS